MKDNLNNLSLQEPKLPAKLVEARRNHAGMTVPEGFFESFEKKMNAVIDAEVLVEKSKQTPVLIPQQKKSSSSSRRWINVAAAALLVIVLGAAFQFDILGLKNQSADNSLSKMKSIADTEQIGIEQMPEVLQEPEIEEMLADVNDFEIFEMYCEI